MQFTISIPTDEGFLGRECGAPECGRYFRVDRDSLAASMHCPYCGVDFPNDQLWTEDQLRYTRATVERDVVPMVQQQIAEMTRRFKHLKFTPARLPTRPDPAPPVERSVDSELTCPDCSTRFQVDGIFGYCPGCSTENLRLYDANLAIIKREIAESPQPERALRHAYGDLVSTFETFCRKEAARFGEERGRFQVIDHTRRLFKDRLGVDMLAGLTPDQGRLLKRVFEKRHVHDHNGGAVSQRYVEQIPEDASLLGKQAPLSVEELEAAAGVLGLVLERLVLAR